MRLSNIALYDKSTIDFYNQGLGILSDAISSESTEAVQDNGNITYEMTLKYPINGVLADKLKLPNLIRAQESEDPNDFMIFEIYDYDEDDDGEMTVYAQALPYRVLRLPFNDEAKFATKYNDVQELFDDAIKRVTGFPTWFKINSDVKVDHNLNFKDSQFENLGKLLDATMGLIDATVEYQWNQINILQSRGRDLSNIVLRDDKNTNGVKITGSYEKIINKVVPIIRNRNDKTGEFVEGTHMGKVVTSKDPFKWIPYYAGVTAAFDSQEEANNYISSNKLDNPAITVDVTPLMVDEDLTQVHTFDRITAYSTKLKYQDTLQVTTRVFDQLNAEVVSFKMGSIKKDINSTTSYTLNSLASEIARAQNIARGAARSADGKNTNYYAEATPANSIEGDLWFHKIDGKDVMQQYINGEWTTIVKDGMGEEIQAYVDQKMLENDEALAGLNTKLQDNDEALAGLNTKLQDNDEAMDKLHTDLESNTQTINDNKEAVDDAMGKVNENLTQAQSDVKKAVSDADQAVTTAQSSSDASGLATQTANAASDAASAAKQLSTEVSNNFAIVKTQAATAVNDAATALDQAKSAVDKANSTASEFGKVSQKTDSAVASALAAQNAASSAVSQASSAAADSKDAKQIAGAVSQSYKTLTDGSTMTIAELESGLAVKLTKTDLNGYATQSWTQNQIKMTADGINGTMSSIKGTVDSHTTNINDLKADSSSFKSQFTTVNNALGKQTTDIGSLQASSRELTSGFNTLTTDNVTNKNDISQLKQTSTEVSSTLETVQTQVQNSAVGTNLLTNTGDLNANWYLNGIVDNNRKPAVLHHPMTTLTSSGSSSIIASQQLNDGLLQPSTTYTASFYAKGTGTFRFYCYPNVGIAIDDNLAYIKLSSNFQLYTITFTTVPNLSGNKNFLLRQDYTPEDTNQNTVEAYVYWFKLEKGSVATDWCPNPMDSATVTAVSKISQTVDGMQTDISKKIEQKDLNGYATETWTQNQIKITADGINGTLSKKIEKTDLNGYATETWAQNQITTTAQGIQTQLTNVQTDIRTIQWQTVSTPNADLNTYTTTGKYFFKITTIKNGPGIGWAYVIVEAQKSAIRVIQTYQADNNNSLQWQRISTDNHWSDWKRIANDGDIKNAAKYTDTKVAELKLTVDGLSATFAKQTDLTTATAKFKVTADGLNLLTAATGTKGEKVTQVIADVNNIKTTMTGANGVTTRLQTLEGFQTTATSNITNLQTQQTTLAGQYTSLIESTDNKVRKPWFDDGKIGTWSGSNAVVAGPDSNVQKLTGHSKYLKVFNRDNYENGVGWFSVTPGEVYYFSGYMGSWGTTYAVGVGLNFITESGTYSWITAARFLANSKTPISAITGSIKVPAGVVRAQTWVQIDGPGGKDLGFAAISGLRISKSASSSQITQLQGLIDQRVMVDGKIAAALSLSADGGGTVTIRGASLYVTAASHFDTASIQSAAIANLDAAKITSGSISSDRLTTTKLNANNITSGSISADRLATTKLNANNITSGSISSDRLATTKLNADNITSGSIAAARIATTALSATNITSGTLDVGKLTVKNLSASLITSGTIDASNINVVNLNASNITSGYINTDRIGTHSLSVNKISDSSYIYDDTDTAQDGRRYSGNWSLERNHIIFQGHETGAYNGYFSTEYGGDVHKSRLYSDSAMTQLISRVDINASQFQMSNNWAGPGSIIRPNGSFIFSNLRWNGAHSFHSFDGGPLYFNSTTDNNTVQLFAKDFVKSSKLSMKTDIKKLDEDLALSTLLKTDVELYKYNDDTVQQYAGLIIDDVNDTPMYNSPAPFVSANREGVLESNLTAYLIQTIKQLNKRIETLEAAQT